MVGSVGAVLLGIAGVIAFGIPGQSKGGIEVLNLAADETLFVAGVAVESANVKARGSGSQIIAVAKEGRLVRFGTAMVQDRLDTRALIAAPAKFEDRPDQAGRVQVTSDPPGCFVMLQGATDAAQKAPATFAVSPGFPRTVEVACPGRGLWSEQILAVPGQSILLSVSPPL